MDHLISATKATLCSYTFPYIYTTSSFSLNLWSHRVLWHAHCPETTRSFLKIDHELTWESVHVILRLERLWCLSWFRWFQPSNTCCSSYCRCWSLVWVKRITGWRSTGKYSFLFVSDGISVSERENVGLIAGWTVYVCVGNSFPPTSTTSQLFVFRYSWSLCDKSHRT